MIQQLAKLIKYLTIITLLIMVNNAWAEPKPDKDQPISIKSDNGDFNDKTGIAIYHGNVIMIQGSRHLTADKLIIERDSNGKINTMIAYGHKKLAKFRFQPDPAKPVGYSSAKVIKFFPNKDLMIFIGQAELQQNSDLIRGAYLVYHMDTGILNSKSKTNQRTTVIINNE